MSSNSKLGANVVLSAEAIKCDFCGRLVVKSGVKCNLCPKVFHRNCSGKVKKCCVEEEIKLSSEISTLRTPEVDELELNKISKINNESSYIDLLLRIISELETKNSILEENNNLLRFKISTLEQIPHKNHSSVPTRNASGKNGREPVIAETVTDVPARKRAPAFDISGGIPPAATTDSSASELPSQLNATQAGLSSMRIPNKRRNKTSQNISKPSANENSANILNSKTMENKSTGSDDEWKLVGQHKRTKKRSSRTLVVGNFSGPSNVEGIEKFRALHVTNLKPDTTVENLQVFLGGKFSQVKCEALSSRYPQDYASFKVMIPTDEYDRALIGTNWPNRAIVHNFFQRKKANKDQ